MKIKQTDNNIQYIIGLHSVNHLLKHRPYLIKTILLQQNGQDQRFQTIIKVAKKKRINIQSIHKKALDQQVTGQNHQGIVAISIPFGTQKLSYLTQYLKKLKTDPFLLVLDGIQDPHNLGACLRCAETAGIHAVVIPKHNRVSLTTTVCKIACGAASLVPVIEVTNMQHTLTWLKKKGLWIYGACASSQISLYQTNLKGPIAIVLGSENKGIRSLVKKQCDQFMLIPMHGCLSSLNVSVACGICLFEAVRQRFSMSSHRA